LITLKTFTLKYRFWSRVLLSLVVLCVARSSATAIPLSEYTSAIESSIADIGSLLARDGHESDVDYESRFTTAIGNVRTALPRNQQVELEKLTWTTDNSWIHSALDNLERANIEDRNAKLENVLDALNALNERVGELEAAQRVDEHKGASKQKLESILSRPEYTSAAQGPNAITRLLRDLIRWIESLMPKQTEMAPGRARFISTAVMFAIIGVAVSIIAYVVWLLFKRFYRPGETKPRKKREPRIVLGERLQPEQTSADLLAEAEALARNGDLRAAIRKGYIALLVELGDRDLISLAQYKTNRDYLRAVSNLPQLHPPLKRLTESFERHWYGFAQATQNDWQDFRARYREALQTGN
jgi:hypothetical protein